MPDYFHEVKEFSKSDLATLQLVSVECSPQKFNWRMRDFLLGSEVTSPTYGRKGSAVAQLALRGLAQLIHVELAAVAHLDVVAPVAAVLVPVITNLPRHHAFLHLGVLAVEPAGSIGTTAVLGHTGGRHQLASGYREAVPFGGQLVITKNDVLLERRQSVGIAQQGEGFAFRLTWGESIDL